MGFLYSFYIQLILPLAYFVCGVMRTSTPSLVYLLFFFMYAGWNLSEGIRFGTLIKPILTTIVALTSIITEIVYICSQSLFSDTLKDVFGLVAPSKKGIINDGLNNNAFLALYFISDIIAILFSVITIVVIVAHAKYMKKKEEERKRKIENGEIDDIEDSTTTSSSSSSSSKGKILDNYNNNDDDEDNFDEENSIKRIHFVPTLPLWRAVLAIVFASLASSFDPSVVFLPYVVFVVATIIYVALPRYGRMAYQRIHLPYWTTAWGVVLSLYILAHMLSAYMYQFSYISKEDGGTIVQWLGIYKYSKLTGTDYWPLFVADLCTATLFIIVSPSLNSFAKMSNAEAVRITRSYTGLTEKILGISAQSFAENSRMGSSRSSGVSTPGYFSSNNNSINRYRYSSSNSNALPQTIYDVEKADTDASKAKNKKRRTYRIARALYPHGWKIFMILFYVLPFTAPGIPMFVLLLTLTISTFLDAYKSALFCPFVLFLSLFLTCVQYIFNIEFPEFLALRYTHGPLMDDLSIPLIGGQLVGLFFSYQFILMFFAATYVRFQNLLICVGLYGPSFDSYPLEDVEEEEEEEEEKVENDKKEKGEAAVEKKEDAKSVTENSDDRKKKKKRKSDKLTDKLSQQQQQQQPSSLSSSSSTSADPIAEKPAAPEKSETNGNGMENAEGYHISSALGLFGIDDKKEKDHPAVIIAEKMEKLMDYVSVKFKAFGKKLKIALAFLLIKVLKYSYFLSLIVIYFACLRGTNCINFVFMIVFLVFMSFPKIATDYWVSLVRYSQFVLHLRYIWQIHWTPSHKDCTALRIIGIKKDPSQPIGMLLIWEILVVVFATIQMFFLQIVNQTETDDATKAEGDNTSSSSTHKKASIKRHLIEEEEGVGEERAEKNRHQSVQVVPSYIARQYRSKNVVKSLYQSVERKTPESVNIVLDIIKYGLCTMGVLFCILAFVVIGILMPVSVISISFMVIAFICMNFVFYTDNFARSLRRVWPIFLIWQAIALFSCYAFQFKELRISIENAYDKSPIKDYFELHEWGLFRLRKQYRFVGLLPHIILFLISTIQFSLLKNEKNVQVPGQSNIFKWVTYVTNFICRFVFEYSPFIMYVFSVVVFLNHVTAIHFVLLVFVSLSRLHPMGIDGIGGAMMWCTEILCVMEQLYNTTLFKRLDSRTRSIFAWVGFYANEKPFDPNHPTEIHTENWSMLYVYIILIALVCIERVTLRWGTAQAENVEREHDTPRDIPLLMMLDNYPSKTPEEKTPTIVVLNFVSRLPGLLYYQVTFTLLCMCLFMRAKSLISLLYLVAIVVTISVRNFNFRKWVFPFSIIVMIVTFVQYVNIYIHIQQNHI